MAERGEGGREGGSEGGREGRREGGKERGREGGKEGGSEGGREGGREGGQGKKNIEKCSLASYVNFVLGGNIPHSIKNRNTCALGQCTGAYYCI